jgi:hypothetical protein
MWNRIPAELRALAQWVCCRPDKIPLDPRTGQRASVADPATWGTFEEAIASQMWRGFVLNSDPYTVIDLDDKGNLSREQQDIHARILSAFSDTYIERSISGRGFHIWCRGLVHEASKRDSVEIYSRDRYMICTGDVANDKPIVDKQSLLLQLVGEMRPHPTSAFADQAASLSDDQIWQRASTAANADKFIELCEGLWQDLGYPSWSEADEALLSILAFYSKSNDQVVRMFRQTRLGERKKAQRNDYLERSLKRVRSTEIAPVDLSMLASPVNPATVEGNAKAFARPPGIVGDIADYIYATAVRPVPEIALAGAIALVAGIAGRCYNISNTGLNQYLIVLAPTGTGKEGAAQGIDKLVTAVRQVVPSIDTFIGPRSFASGQGLVRSLENQPCFVSVLGEVGLTLQQICDPSPNSSHLALRQMLLDLYSKSGWAQNFRCTAYSDRDKNTKDVQAPAVSLLGESTPETFFDSLSSLHIASGLIPRFSLIEYSGPRVPINLYSSIPPTKDLVERVAALAACALASNQNRSHVDVETEPLAKQLLDSFGAKVDAAFNANPGEIERQLWNRAHLKALRLSALLAVGDNVHYPKVSPLHAEWAIDFVERDVNSMLDHFASGSVGHGDHRLSHDVREAFSDYLQCPPAKRQNSYKIPKALLDKPIAPYSYFVRRLQRTSPFQQDRRGASKALTDTLNSLVAEGVLTRLPPQQAASQFSSTVALYCAGEGWDF